MNATGTLRPVRNGCIFSCAETGEARRTKDAPAARSRLSMVRPLQVHCLTAESPRCPESRRAAWFDRRRAQFAGDFVMLTRRVAIHTGKIGRTPQLLSSYRVGVRVAFDGRALTASAGGVRRYVQELCRTIRRVDRSVEMVAV